jgi:hypothetical protein
MQKSICKNAKPRETRAREHQAIGKMAERE